MTLIIGNLEPSTSAFDAEPSTAQYIGAILTMIDGLRSKVAFYAYDANGNVTDLVGTNGQFLAQYQFDPYGNTISKTGALADVNPFRFSTKYLDSETGLYYFGHRYYIPEIGRWLSRDPIEEQLLIINRTHSSIFAYDSAMRFVAIVGSMTKRLILKDVYGFCRNNPNDAAERYNRKLWIG